MRGETHFPRKSIDAPRVFINRVICCRVRYAMASRGWPLTLATGSLFIRGISAEYHIGTEYVLAKMAALRVGYNSADQLDSGLRSERSVNACD